MTEQLWQFYESVQDLADCFHGFLNGAGLMFLAFNALLWKCVANLYHKRQTDPPAQRAALLACAAYFLLRTEAILDQGGSLLLQTAIHIYLLYHIAYSVFFLLLLASRPVWTRLFSHWPRRIKGALYWIAGTFRSRRERLKQRILDELHAPEQEKQRRAQQRQERLRRKVEQVRKQYQYDLDLQYTLLTPELRKELGSEIFGKLCRDALDTDDIPTMEKRVQKLQQLLATFGSGASSTRRQKTSRINEIGSEFAEQREQINASTEYDQRQKDHLTTFLNRLEGVELENYLKGKIRGVSD